MLLGMQLLKSLVRWDAMMGRHDHDDKTIVELFPIAHTPNNIPASYRRLMRET